MSWRISGIGMLWVLGAAPSCGQANVSFMRAWGGAGGGDAQFHSAHAIAFSPLLRIYVADESNHRIQYFGMNGAFQGKWGAWGSDAASLKSPGAIAVRGNGDVYVVERDNHRVHYFTADGAHLGMWGSQGAGDGQFSSPSAAAFAPDDTLYVADRYNHRIQHFTASGAFIGTFGASGSGSGQFNEPMGIAVSPLGAVYVSDSQNRRVQCLSTNGVFVGAWGSAGAGNGQFGSASAYNTGPAGIDIDRRGFVYVADPDNSRIQVFDPAGLFLGKLGSYGSGNGQFYFPNGAACAPGWQAYVADELNNRVQQFTVAIGPRTNAAIVAMGLSGADWTMRVDAIPERDYAVVRSQDLASWTVVTNLNIPEGLFAVTNAAPPGAPRLFYRVERR